MMETIKRDFFLNLVYLFIVQVVVRPRLAPIPLIAVCNMHSNPKDTKTLLAFCLSVAFVCGIPGQYSALTLT